MDVRRRICNRAPYFTLDHLPQPGAAAAAP